MKRGFSHAVKCFVTIARTLQKKLTMAADQPTYVDPLILLGDACAALGLETLPPAVLRCARQRVLDTLGCLIAGYSGGISDAVRDYVLAQGGNAKGDGYVFVNVAGA